jgi:hypothetical protein
LQKSSSETAVTVAIDGTAPLSVGDAATEYSFTYYVASNQLYDITVALISANSASSLFRVLWRNDGNAYVNYGQAAADSPILTKTIIGRDSFFRIRTNTRVVRDDQALYFDTNAGWPQCGSTSGGNVLRWIQCRGQGVRSNDVLSVEVNHAVICASTSTIVIANAVSAITAGITGTFDMVVRDQFSNILDSDSDAILIKISLNTGSESAFYGSVVPTATGTSVADPKGRYSVSYVVTRAGTFSLAIAAVGGSGNGLMGSFFNNQFFTDAAATRTFSSIDLNWGMDFPVSQIRSATGWSARWTGFLRLVDSASSMYSFYLNTGFGGGRLYVANKLVIDSTNMTNDYKSGGEFSGSVSLSSNVVYDVSVEYVAASAPAYVTLSYSSYSQDKIILPSSALFPFSSTFSNGAQTLSVFDSRRNCGASSRINGRGLTIATAGISAVFTITSVDQYGNRRSSQSTNPDCAADATCVFSAVAVPDNALTSTVRTRGAAVTQSTNEFFTVAYTATLSAGYSLSVTSSPVSGGLWATYYDDVGWTGPRLSQQQPDPTWTLTTTDVPVPAAAALTKDGLWSVRYRGSLKPASAGWHTFSFSVTEKFMAIVDGSRLVDTYSTPYSGAATTVTGSINLPNANAFYEIHLMYESDVSSGSTFAATINAGSYSSLSSSLFASTSVDSMPSRLIVYPNSPCGSTSTLRGRGLSLATAGVIARFTVTLRDAYGNLRNAADGLVVASAFSLTGSGITGFPSHNLYQGTDHNPSNTCPSCPIAPVSAQVTAGSSSELYNVQITLTKTGNYKMTASVAQPGGLTATYYARDGTAFGYSTAVSSTSSFGSVDYTTTAAIAGRWQGYVRPSRAGSYTFSVEPVAASDGHLRLWISQTLVIDRSASAIPSTGFSAVFSFPYANNLYDVFVAYNSLSSVTAAGFRLYWQSAQVPGKLIPGDTQKEKIPTDRLYNRGEVTADGYYSATHKVTLNADVGSSRTYATGNDLTLTTAGTAGSFTITSRDTFDNSRTTNDNSVSAAIFSSDGFPKSAALTFLSCSSVCTNRVSYTASTFTRSGSYSVIVYDRAFVVRHYHLN